MENALEVPASVGAGEPLPLNTRKPSWLRAKIPGGPAYQETAGIVRERKLHTVCESAQCPNLGECWSRKTATIMILGNICTRSCGFCAVQTGRPTELDRDEPRRVADAIRLMGLGKPVIVSSGEETSRYPGDACLRVDAGSAEEEMLTHYMLSLRHLPGFGSEIGSRAAEYIRRWHSVERIAELYWETLCAFRQFA